MRLLTVEEIRDRVATLTDNTYKCLTQTREFRGGKNKILFSCPKNHEFYMRLKNFIGGKRCPECKKKDLSFIKEYALENGCKCISDNYVNSTSKLHFLCGSGHEFQTSWSHFKAGHRCQECSERKHRDIDYIKDYISKFGYTCLSQEYKSATHTKLEILCNNNHHFLTNWSIFRSGSRCPICDRLRKCKSFDYIKEYTTKFGYMCTSQEYVNSKTNMDFLCTKGHHFKMTWNSFNAGQRCYRCYHESRRLKSDEYMKEFNLYRNVVNHATSLIYTKYKKILNPNNLRRGFHTYHIDHIYSVIDGFNNKVSTHIINSPINLRMLYWKDNVSKNGRSDMTLGQLYIKYKRFIKKGIYE